MKLYTLMFWLTILAQQIILKCSGLKITMYYYNHDSVGQNFRQNMEAISLPPGVSFHIQRGHRNIFMHDDTSLPNNSTVTFYKNEGFSLCLLQQNFNTSQSESLQPFSLLLPLKIRYGWHNEGTRARSTLPVFMWWMRLWI